MTRSLLFLLAIASASAGCGYGKPACTVIDAAAAACTVVRYLGPDGKMHLVHVTPAEMQLVGEAVSAHHADIGQKDPE